MDKHKVFRGASWVAYGLIGVTGVMLNGYNNNQKEVIEMTEKTMKTEHSSVDQNRRIQKEQRLILDRFDACAKQKKYLDDQTGECK